MPSTPFSRNIPEKAALARSRIRGRFVGTTTHSATTLCAAADPCPASGTFEPSTADPCPARGTFEPSTADPCPGRGTFEPSTGSTNGKRNRLSVIGVESGSPTQTIRLHFAAGYLVDSGSAVSVLPPTPEETGNLRPIEHMNISRYHLERYGRRSFCVAGPTLWNGVPPQIGKLTPLLHSSHS